AL
ncbi:hypothetical protein S40285_10778, partial [Stachybotrys chlorohalonatus IBT 40285]